ncbi:MAG TPA: isocitrate lyase/PEP mutase family protein [Casimicrobiaceae bacterium]|jgi:2-methylisocitrate lyase-like PEP mutase family enzyme|nr:isocitrate lyase/PEP mutase family protein [Casimicrobiaceae bacterium]
MTAAQRLRELLQGEDIVLAAGAPDALTARLVEEAGFPLCVVGGNALAMARGYPDLALITMSEVLDAVRYITSAVSIPVISDADTGYGGVLNVWRTVRCFEEVGVAGIHIEDQVWPKRAGHMEGKNVIPVPEMIGKIRAAVAGRRDPSFVVIVRCDALTVHGLEETLARGEAYLNAGADVLFFETRDRMQEIEAIASRFAHRVPLLWNHSESGKVPLLSAEELKQLGFKICAFYGHAQLAGCLAIRETLAEILRTRNSRSTWNRLLPLDDTWEIVGLSKLLGMQRRFAGVEDRQPPD